MKNMVEPKRIRRRSPSEHLTVDEVAKVSNLSPGAVRWNIVKGYLSAEKDGYRYHIRRQDMERWLEMYYK